MAEYPKTPRSTVNRVKNRAAYDHETIHTIIDTSPVLHVSFVPLNPSEDPFPTTLPMLGCTGAFSSPDTCLYIHGWVSARLMRSPSSAQATPAGTPVCVSATHMDGLVLALTPFHHSCNYRSAVVHGYATLVSDEAEKLYALERIADNMLAGRWAHSRVPPTPAEMKSTSVLKIEIMSASAKVRVGGPKDDRADMKNEEMREKVWTGVVPFSGRYGEPVPAKDNVCKELPAYVRQFVDGENERGAKIAREAVDKVGK